MKNGVMFLCIAISTVLSQDFSCRIRTLGTNFALLIPDNEMDVWYNISSIKENTVGIYYNTRSETPIKFNFQCCAFGFLGLYWPTYQYTLVPFDNGWRTHTQLNDRLKATIFYSTPKLGFSLTPDIQRTINKISGSTAFYELVKDQESIYGMSASWKISNRLILLIIPAFGIFEKLNELQDVIIHHSEILIPTGKIAIFYRNINKDNKFTSGFISIGAPTSIYEVSMLPISSDIYSLAYDKSLMPFCNSVTPEIGICFGLPIDEKNLFALGLRDRFTAQVRIVRDLWTNEVDSLYIAMVNNSAFPVALEYNINRFTLRLGFYFNVSLSEYETRAVEGYGTTRHYITINDEHNVSLTYDYTAGFGWKPARAISLDFESRYINDYFFHLHEWSVYLKYQF